MAQPDAILPTHPPPPPFRHLPPQQPFPSPRLSSVDSCEHDREREKPRRIANLAAMATNVLRPREPLHTVRYIAQVDIETWMVRRSKVGTTTNMFVVLEGTILSVYKNRSGPPRYQVNVRREVAFARVELLELHIYVSSNPPGKTRLLRLHIASTEEAYKWKYAIENAVNSEIQDYYTFGSVLGSGAYGEVVEAFDVRTGERRAVKIIKKGTNMKIRQHLENEITVMKTISHPNIVQTYQIFDLKRTIYIVMEYVAGGDLFDFVAQHDCLTETQSSQTMRSIFQAVEYLHRNGIVHRDLKPENILCANDTWPLQIKVSDFGFAAFINPSGDVDSTMRTQVGTVYFMAPEIVSNQEYGAAVDSWACGVILYTILTGRLPFPGKNTPEYFKNVLKGKPSFPGFLWKGISEDAISLVKGLLNPDPNKRLTALGALQHRWITSPVENNNEIRRDRSNLHSKRRRLFKARKAIIAVAMASKFKATIPQVVDAVGDSTKKVKDGIEIGVKKTADGVKMVGDGIGEGTKKVAEEIGEGTKKVASGIAGGTKKVADGIGTGVKRTVDGVEISARKVSEGVKKTADGIETGLKKTADGIETGLKKTADGIETGIKKTAGGIETGIKKTAGGIETGIKKTAGGIETGIKKTAGGIETGIKKTAGGIETGIKKTAGGIETGLKKTAGGIETGIKKTADGIGEGLKKTADGLETGLKKTADGLGEGLKKTAGGIEAGLKKTGEGIKTVSIHAVEFVKVDKNRDKADSARNNSRGSRSDSTNESGRRRPLFRRRGQESHSSAASDRPQQADVPTPTQLPTSIPILPANYVPAQLVELGSVSDPELLSEDIKHSSSEYYSAMEEQSEAEEGWSPNDVEGTRIDVTMEDGDSDVTPPRGSFTADIEKLDPRPQPFPDITVRALLETPSMAKRFSNVSYSSSGTPACRPNLTPLDGLPMGLSDNSTGDSMDCGDDECDTLRRAAALLLAASDPARD